MKLAAAILVALAGAAQAGPTARFGMTFAMADGVAPSEVHQIGPLVALGERVGPFVGEVEWAYLSLFDPEASPAGVHRFGVTLRADLLRDVKLTACHYYACTQAKSLYVEGGAGERIGVWQLPNTVPTTTPTPEVHLGVGFETDNQVIPNRNGWQLGLRLTLSRSEIYSYECRTTGGSCMGPAMAGGDLAKAVFVEWMYLLGR